MTVNKRGIEFLQDPALNINHAYRPECATQAPRNPNQQRAWHKVRPRAGHKEFRQMPKGAV
jgi:hypothetical protein